MVAAAAGGGASGAVAGSMGGVARLGGLFVSRRCNREWKGIKFSLLQHSTGDSGGAHGLAPTADASEEKTLHHGGGHLLQDLRSDSGQHEQCNKKCFFICFRGILRLFLQELPIHN